jgi:protein tyrosine/serine phosphatase
MDEFEPLDPTYVQETLLKPPFLNVSGVINFRDIGNLPSQAYPGSVTKPGYLFRSAELSSITEGGRAKIRDLGITKIFDLRSDTEIAKYNSPLPTIDNVTVLHIPIFKTEDYSPEMMAKSVLRTLRHCIHFFSHCICRRYALYAKATTEVRIQIRI